MNQPSPASAPHRSRPLAVLACVLLIAAAVTVPFHGALVGDRCILSFDSRLPGFIPFAVAAPADVAQRPANLLTPDLNGWIVPETTLGVREVKAGRLPLWNPYVLCGQPLLANLAFPLFYPPNALHLFLDPLRAFAWITLMHMALAGVFCVLLLRRLGVQPSAALLGGLAVALSAWLATRLHLPMIVHTAAWLFGLLWAAEGVAARPTWRRAALLALMVGMCALAGFPQLFGLLLIGTAVYLGSRLLEPGRRRIRAAVVAAPAVLLGIGLAAVSVLPSSQLYEASLRKSMVDPTVQASRALKPVALIGLLLPEFFGSPVHPESMPPVVADYLPHRLWLGSDIQENAVENAVWPGSVVLMLGLAGMCVALRRRAGRPLLLLLLVGLALSVRSPLLDAIHHALPPLSAGSPKRALVLVVLPLGALAALGASALLGARPWAWRLLGGTALALGVALLGVAGVAQRIDPQRALAAISAMLASAPSPPIALDEVVRFLAFTFERTWPRALAFLLIGAILLLFANAGARRVVALHALAVLLVVELGQYAVAFNPLQERAGQYPETPAIAFLTQSGERSARLANMRIAAALLGPLYGYRSIDGGEPMVLRPTGEVLEAIEPGRFSPIDPRVADAFADPASFAHPLFLRTATSLIATAQQIDGVPGLEVAYVGEAEGIGIYRQTLALPRVRLVAGHRVEPDATARLAALCDPSLDARRLVLLEQSPGSGFAAGEAEPIDAAARVIEEVPGRLRIAVEPVTLPAVLVIADSYHPGWQAAVDGVDAPVLRADHAFCAVPLPAGAREVTLRYQPRSFFLGLAISIASLLAWLWLIARREPPAPQPLPDSTTLPPPAVIPPTA